MTIFRTADKLLMEAVRSAPRRYRMPALPDGGALAGDAQVDLAVAIEEARAGRDARERFTSALADLVRASLRSEGGDPSFLSLVLRTQHPEVEEYVRLAAQSDADRRAVRAAVDAIAHPGKLRGMAAGRERDELARLHRLATDEAWIELEHAVAATEAFAAIASHPALHRLLRSQALRAEENVQRHEDVLRRRGPLAGSDAATERGRTSARAGDAAEEATVHALREIAKGLDQRTHAGTYRVARSLLTPRGFPGAAEKTKDEWDVALLRDAGGDGAYDLVLVAEVKASPAAATSDLARLLRGLRRLSHAEAQAAYGFPSADGELRIRGASLRALRPHDHALPPKAIYCCTAPAETQATVLSAASRAVLLGEPASLAFADEVLRGQSPPHADLAPVWESLRSATRLRSALHQYDTARTVREAMLHPADLLASFERIAAQP